MDGVDDGYRLKRSLAILVIGVICLSALVFRTHLAWSAAFVFLICSSGLILVTRGMIDLVRLKYHGVLNEAVKQPKLDFFPWILIFPICVAWWMLVKSEPTLDTSHLVGSVGQVMLVAFIFPLMIGSVVPWPSLRTMWQRRCEILYRAGSIMCVVLLLLGIALQLHQAEMPIEDKPPHNVSVVAQANMGIDHHCDPEDDEDDCVSNSTPALSVPTTAPLSPKTESTFWLDQILNSLSAQFENSQLPFHLSSGVMSLVGLLHFIARLLSHYSAANEGGDSSAIDAPNEPGQLTEALSVVNAIVTELEPPASEPAPEALSVSEVSRDVVPQTQPQAQDNFISLTSAIERLLIQYLSESVRSDSSQPVTSNQTSDSTKLLTEMTSVNEALPQPILDMQNESSLVTTDHPIAQQKTEIPAISEVAPQAVKQTAQESGDEKASLVASSHQETAGSTQGSSASQLTPSLANHEQTLIQLQSLLQNAGGSQDNLIQHKTIVQQLLALAANKAP